MLTVIVQYKLDAFVDTFRAGGVFIVVGNSICSCKRQNFDCD